MEEEVGVKVPMTRLRRRLSVELSEESSPSGPATPTKKRGSRLAAKPQLELIDENAPQNSPKKTRKSLARDVVELAEEKPATPSRRGTRVKSNTSIVSDITQNIDSPRAKRAAARKNSQVGSDNETALTPARTRRTRNDSITSDKQDIGITDIAVTPGRTRRTRNNSASSVDKQENDSASKPDLTIEVIFEEPDYNLTKSSGTSGDKIDANVSPNSIRKSPRLQAKKGKRSNSTKSESENQASDKVHSTSIGENDTEEAPGISAARNKSSNFEKNIDVHSAESYDANMLSISSANLIKNLEREPKNFSNLNKSTSALDCLKKMGNKRHRTKSWTTLSVPSPSNGNFYSDNESTKKKLPNDKEIFKVRLSSQAGSGDGDPNRNETDCDKIHDEKDSSEITLSSSKKKKKRSEINENNYTAEILNESATKSAADIAKEDYTEKVKHHDLIQANLILQKAPSGDIKSMIFIEDSDSNTDSLGIVNNDKRSEAGGQCVPMIDHVLKNRGSIPAKEETSIHKLDIQQEDCGPFSKREEKITVNDSCEPMDIDETVPGNISLKDFSNEHEIEESITNDKIPRKLSLSIVQEADHGSKASLNNTKRKSTLSQSISQDIDKSNNENRSTLVLSEIKDVSPSGHDMSKSPNDIIYDMNYNSDVLSKSLNIPDVVKDGIINKNISLSCLTSTPVQQKDDKKLGMQMNSSAITPNIDTKRRMKKNNKMSNKASSRTRLDSSDESLSDDNNMVIDEAEDAGDDYESGDSRDEDERQFEEENEILERGETLSSDDDISNDSDYEKDSFIVSSNEEDNELLSGSEDDLEISDNELTMSAKSKKKYNDRSLKQQKKASREMFESRHKLNDSDKGSKETPKCRKNNRLDSTLLESGDEAMLPPKKNKRMRLDSTLDSVDAKSDSYVSDRKNNSNLDLSETNKIGHEKKKTIRLSESICDESTTKEKKIKGSKIQVPLPDDLDESEIRHKKKKIKPLSESTCNISTLNESKTFNDKDITTINAGHLHETTNNSMSLSQSVCNDENVMNEREMFVCDEKLEETDDPLLMKIKPEPKTPLKGLDISTVHFTDRREVEQVVVNENVSILKPNDTFDHLQDTMAKEKSSNEDTCSSISENEEITKNYDSVLIELNNDNEYKPTKFSDISLDLNKKSKQEKRESLLEQLNITQTKGFKSKNNTKVMEPELQGSINSVSNKTKKNYDNEHTPDSLDLQLLFSDDSNDDRACEKTNKDIENTDKFIPLKRTEGKTNIRGNINTNAVPMDDTEINDRTNKKYKKRKSAQNQDIHTNNYEEDNLNFFIDTTGTRFDEDLIPIVEDMAEVVESETDDKKPNENTHSIFTNTPDNDKKKKKKLSVPQVSEKPEHSKIYTNEVTNSKKRKRKSSTNQLSEETISDGHKNLDLSSNQKKKRKVYDIEQNEAIGVTETQNPEEIYKKKKDNSNKTKRNKCIEIRDHELTAASEPESERKSIKKRKERDDEDSGKISKIRKENSLDGIHVPRLPATVLSQLEDKQSKEILEMKKCKVISTTNFVVEEAKRRRNKPSNFLEETICLNDQDIHGNRDKKLKANLKKPKVLPFIPTASTSNSGFTSNFQIKVIPQKVEFIAQSSNMPNFRDDYLHNNRIKKLRTYELYKKHRNVKLSKF